MPLSPRDTAAMLTGAELAEQTALEELVRTGEASRLRRRGAINGGHGRSRSAVYSTSGMTTETSSFVVDTLWTRVPSQGRPPWAEQSSTVAAAAEPIIYPAWSSSSEADQSKAEDDSDSQRGAGYSLYCGFEEWDFSSPAHIEPYLHSPFPASSRSRKKSSRRSCVKSTGCGTLIHTNATPRTRDGTWHAKGKATQHVVALDKMYFKHGGLPKQFACGCRWHGVGCALCGNPLGNVYLPCQAASTTAVDSQQQQRRTTRSSSSRSSSRTSGSQHHVYTFFCNALTSSPAFVFPERCLSQQMPELPVPPPLSGASTSEYRPSSTRTPERGARTGASTGVSPAGRSPGVEWGGQPLAWTPSSGTEDTEYAYGYGMQEVEITDVDSDFDTDGVLTELDEPGSPDKPNHEPMLWPAR